MVNKVYKSLYDKMLYKKIISSALNVHIKENLKTIENANHEQKNRIKLDGYYTHVYITYDFFSSNDPFNNFEALRNGIYFQNTRIISLELRLFFAMKISRL